MILQKHCGVENKLEHSTFDKQFVSFLYLLKNLIGISCYKWSTLKRTAFRQLFLILNFKSIISSLDVFLLFMLIVRAGSYRSKLRILNQFDFYLTTSAPLFKMKWSGCFCASFVCKEMCIANQQAFIYSKIGGVTHSTNTFIHWLKCHSFELFHFIEEINWLCTAQVTQTSYQHQILPIFVFLISIPPWLCHFFRSHDHSKKWIKFSKTHLIPFWINAIISTKRKFMHNNISLYVDLNSVSACSSH